MKELMSFIYSILSTYAPTSYQDLERNDDGEVILPETSLTYNIDSMLYNEINKARLDIPLSVDIWYRKKDIYEVEDLVREIGNALTDVIIRGKGLEIFVIRRSGNYILNIPNDNKDIVRKQVNFSIKYYSK